MQKGLPNVSSVFRQIAHIYIPDLHNTGKPGYNSAPYKQSYQSNAKYCRPQESSHEQLYNYKQQKHNELMNRFKNSFQQNRRIIQVCNQNLYGESSIPNRRFDHPVNSSNQEFSYNRTKNSFGQTLQLQSKSSRLNIPQIRYRHIEDFEPKQRHQPYQKESKRIQKQFYGDYREQEEILNTLTRFPKSGNKDMAVQYQQPQQIYADDQKSQCSSQNWVNKQSKYQDKIEDYYQLCRKSNKLSKNVQEEKKEDKFIRKHSTQKRTMELEQAMKLLTE